MADQFEQTCSRQRDDTDDYEDGATPADNSGDGEGRSERTETGDTE